MSRNGRAAIGVTAQQLGTFVPSFVVPAPTGVAATDTTAIQAKIDAATAAGGGIVVLQVGTYLINAALVVGAANTTIQGAGRNATVIHWTTTNAAITSDGHDNVCVELVDFSGNPGSSLASVNVKNCNRPVVRNCGFSGVTAGAAVQFEGTKNGRIEDNSVTGGDYGIVVGTNSSGTPPSTDYNIIDRNDVTGTTHDSIFVTASLASSAPVGTATGNRVTNNTVTDSGDAGIESGTGAAATVINGNYVTGSAGPNILLRDNTDSRVTGNTANANTALVSSYGGGIAVLDQNATSFRVLIANNDCESNTGPGINVVPNSSPTGKNTVIEGNLCRSNAQEGILVTGSPGSVVSGNLCLANTGNGITLKPVGATGQGDMSATGNTCGNNGAVGIAVTAGGVVVVGNRCYDDQVSKTQTYGLSITTSQANYGTFMANDLRDNLTGAINDDAAGTGNTKLNNAGADNNRLYESGAFDLSTTANLNVGGKLAVTDNVGFYGTFPVAKQTGVAVTAAGVHAALVNLGLISA